MSYSLESVTVRFGDVVALQDVSLHVAPGQVVAVVGGNGAGKTTLLRAMVGLVSPASGSVRAPDPANLGYLPATAGSWLELTVAENLDFVGGIFGLSDQRLADRSVELISAAGLQTATDRLSGQLSGGMRRKLGFSLSMVHDPPLLVLDEPSTGIDPVSRVDLWRLISQAAAAGAGVLLSTTYIDEAERAEHLVVLDRGRVVVAGAPDDVRRGFSGDITRSAHPTRPQWAWRRGRNFHEVWPQGAPPDGERVTADLEDVVIALSLHARSRFGDRP